MVDDTDTDTDGEEIDDEDVAADWAAALESEDGEGGEDGEDQDDMAAEWAAMADDDDGDDGSPGATRVLDQDEIDSLLGFDSGPGDGEGESGIRSIINSALVSYERLPMLEVVFDRLVRLMSTSLRNFTSDNVEPIFPR